MRCVASGTPAAEQRALIAGLRAELARRSAGMDPKRFVATAQWHIRMNVQPSPDERMFRYGLTVVQTRGFGCCYLPPTAQPPSLNVVGRDVRAIRSDSPCLELALLDAAFSALPSRPLRRTLLHGLAADKADQRARLICDEAAAQLPGKCKGGRPRVAIIGLVSKFIGILKRKGFTVSAVDLQPSMIGRTVHGVRIGDGRKEMAATLRDADVALVTGMTAGNGSLMPIVHAAREYGTRLVMFAETGAWLAPYFCDVLGIDSVVSEPFPYYIFNGETVINLFRRKAKR
jgi:hypothetical protein